MSENQNQNHSRASLLPLGTSVQPQGVGVVREFQEGGRLCFVLFCFLINLKERDSESEIK